jgi:ribosomal protein L37AE/L43A
MNVSSGSAPAETVAAASNVCPICARATRQYLFSRRGIQVFRCSSCGLTRAEPGGRPGLEANEQAGPAQDTPPSSTQDRAAQGYVAALSRRGASRSRVLAIVEPRHPFLAAAATAGYDIAAQPDIHAVEREGIPGGPYDTAVVLSQLERAANPVTALERIHRALVPGAIVLIVAPSLDSLPARLLGSQWPAWAPEHRSYFDLQTIQSCCLRAGFAGLEWTAESRDYTLDHVDRRAATLAPSLLTRATWAAASFAPASLRRAWHVNLPGSSIIVTARRGQPPSRPLLSVVMPVYNERATFERTLEAVLAKGFPGVDKEIVIVESRSTDGTRELVQRYETHPAVSVIYQERPAGKGAAVREGLAHARGTIVLIQDADDEYDVEDYDALLEPILSYRQAFVLGSRHMGSWKVRHFAEQPAVSAFFNFGHVLFRTALNVAYGQKLYDPFTMYKVFRRDCLHRLKFECNRFDFDFELVIKLLRKGYVPLEVPVNYRSRSFSEGKKVSAVRDPLTWLRALAKYRFASIYEE